MIRRLAVPLVALVAAASFTSCSTFRNADVATVNGHHISQAELKDVLGSTLGSQLLGTATANGSVDVNTVRSLLGGWIGLTAIKSAGLVQQKFVDDATSAEATKYADSWDKAPPVAKELAILNAAISQELSSNAIDINAARNAITTADIRVDPRYGFWDATANKVVAFG